MDRWVSGLNQQIANLPEPHGFPPFKSETIRQHGSAQGWRA
jgi:hypothetical protein